MKIIFNTNLFDNGDLVVVPDGIFTQEIELNNVITTVQVFVECYVFTPE